MKEYLLLKETDYSPYVLFNSQSLSMKGESRLENPQVFFGQILELLKDENTFKTEGFKAMFFFEHLSSSSILFVNYLIREVVKIKGSIIEWHFFDEDEDMRETGEMLAKVNKVNIIFVKKE